MERWPFNYKVSKVYILPYLLEKYPNWLRPEIFEVNILHEEDKCILEIISAPEIPAEDNDERKLVNKIDLSFISCFKTASASIFDDAKEFVEAMDPYSIINTLPLFTKEAEDFINNSYHANKDK